jgi:hypothetical protein
MTFFLFLLATITSTLTVPENPIPYHQDFEVSLNLKDEMGFHPDIETLKKNLLTHSHLKADPFLIKTVEEKNNGKTLIFKLQPLTPGTHDITFLHIPVIKNGKKEEIVSDLKEVTILPLVEPKAIQPKSPIPFFSPSIPLQISEENEQLLQPLPHQPFSFPLLELILLLLIALFLFLTYRAKGQFEEKIEATLEENFLNELKDLKERCLSSEEYYIKLSDLLRRFIEKKYHIDAPTLTTQEFLNQMAKCDRFSKDIKESLTQFLQQIDHIKFAKERPKEDVVDPLTLPIIYLINSPET